MKVDMSVKRWFYLLFAVILSFLIILLMISGCQRRVLERFEDTREKMGTYVEVKVYSDESTALEAIDEAFKKIDELSAIASTYDEQSEISILNNNGYIENPSHELVEMFSLSKEYYDKTDGNFDITIQPILNLWSEGLWEESEEIQEQKISETLKIVGSDKINISDDRIEFAEEGMSATLGGIAKGYIVDSALEVLKSYGIENALINAGGDIATLGSKPDKTKWSISLENPDDTSQKIASFGLDNISVTTSGNYYRYFDPEKEVHHIIDPKTGKSANLCISATIIAKNATIADILSTSVFVMGPEEGMQFVESEKGVETLIIDSERNIFQSTGISEYLEE